jgi:hypothetical protein
VFQIAPHARTQSERRRRLALVTGKVTYEVEHIKDGKELDAYFTEDGQPVKGAQ